MPRGSLCTTRPTVVGWGAVDAGVCDPRHPIAIRTARIADLFIDIIIPKMRASGVDCYCISGLWGNTRNRQDHSCCFLPFPQRTPSRFIPPDVTGSAAVAAEAA